LENDYVMHNILDMLAIEQMQLDCTSCKTEEKAVARCSDCAEFLCPSCVTAHQHMRCFESHSVVKFDDIIRMYKRNMAKIAAATACHDSGEANEDEYEAAGDGAHKQNGKSPSSGSSSSSTNGVCSSSKLDEEIMNINEKMKRKSSSSASSTSSTDYRCNFFKTTSRTSCASSASTPAKLAIDCGVPIHKPLYCKEHVKENLKFFCTTCQVYMYFFFY
jgi:hypothetical protein